MSWLNIERKRDLKMPGPTRFVNKIKYYRPPEEPKKDLDNWHPDISSWCFNPIFTSILVIVMHVVIFHIVPYEVNGIGDLSVSGNIWLYAILSAAQVLIGSVLYFIIAWEILHYKDSELEFQTDAFLYTCGISVAMPLFVAASVTGSCLTIIAIAGVIMMLAFWMHFLSGPY